MYRTNHFNPGDFSVFYFGNAQTQPRKVCTGTCPHLCTILIQLLQQYIQKRVILIRAGNVQLEKTVDLANLLCCAEYRLVCFIKRREQKFPCGEEDCYGYNAKQAVHRGRVVDDDLSCNGKHQHFENCERRVQIEHSDQLYADDQVKTGCEQVIVVGISAGVCQLSHREAQLYGHDDNAAGEQGRDYEFQYLCKVFEKKMRVFLHMRPPYKGAPRFPKEYRGTRMRYPGVLFHVTSLAQPGVQYLFADAQ